MWSTTLSFKLMLKYVVFVAVKDKSDPHDYQDLFAGHLFWHQIFWEAIQHLSSGVTQNHSLTTCWRNSQLIK